MKAIYNEKLKDVLKNIPNKSGVYRYYDIADNLLYVGKAKNLKKRVTSYFQGSKIISERMLLLLSQIDRIEYSTVDSEKEALILEANLIHSLQPKFNILLKNDSSYLYIRRTNDPIPSYQIVRKKYDPNSKYFGPYTKKFAINDVLRSLRIIFPYCEAKIPQSKPCYYCALKQCNGICYGNENYEEYIERLKKIEAVLNGKTKDVKEELKNKMIEAINKEDYELAALWRDKIKLLDETIYDQKAILPNPQDIDLLTLIISVQSDGLLIGSFYIQNIRDGKINNVNNYLLSGSEDLSQGLDNINDVKEMAKSFLIRFFSSYINEDNVPIHIQTYLEEMS